MQRGQNCRTAGAVSCWYGFLWACKYYATAKKLHNKIEEAGLNFFLSLRCVFISFILYDFVLLFGLSIDREKCIFFQLHLNTTNFVCQVHFWIMI